MNTSTRKDNNHPDDVFTVDANNPTQLLAAEIYSRFDLNQDGIIGVDLINELASGARWPGNTWYQGRNRFAYSSDQGIILTQQRLDVANPALGDTTPAYSAGSYDLRNLPASNTDHNGPSAVDLDSSRISSTSRGLLCLLFPMRSLISKHIKRSMALSCSSMTQAY